MQKLASRQQEDGMHDEAVSDRAEVASDSAPPDNSMLDDDAAAETSHLPVEVHVDPPGHDNNQHDSNPSEQPATSADTADVYGKWMQYSVFAPHFN